MRCRYDEDFGIRFFYRNFTRWHAEFDCFIFIIIRLVRDNLYWRVVD